MLNNKEKTDLQSKIASVNLQLHYQNENETVFIRFNQNNEIFKIIRMANGYGNFALCKCKPEDLGLQNAGFFKTKQVMEDLLGYRRIYHTLPLALKEQHEIETTMMTEKRKYGDKLPLGKTAVYID